MLQSLKVGFALILGVTGNGNLYVLPCFRVKDVSVCNFTGRAVPASPAAPAPASGGTCLSQTGRKNLSGQNTNKQGVVNSFIRLNCA